ncbi:MAG TPA: hypothetical protein VMP00_05350 [Burkholderiales bacterium]|nr:hypothetical protein [Burkholderiales bacterium]
MNSTIWRYRRFQWLRSRRLRYLVGGTAILFALFALLRMVFLFGFSDAAGRDDIDGSDILKALGIGFRFDLRLAILAMLPLGLLACRRAGTWPPCPPCAGWREPISASPFSACYWCTYSTSATKPISRYASTPRC